MQVRRGTIDESVVELCRRLDEKGARGWVVGGGLRDLLLGKEVQDWDVATSATPEEVQQIFGRVIPTGIDHGTVTVLMHGQAYEVTTLRGEGGYSDGRRPDEVFYVDDIEQDLARRDFTVNAIAYDPVSDRLIDPFGGIADLQAGVLKAVGDPAERFAEDGLRILRGARFAATLEFELDPATEAAFAGAVPTYAKVSRERIREEWLKTMKAIEPSRAFEVMRRSGILDVTFPALLEQVGCAQNRYHAYDVWNHTMAVLDGSTGSAIDRLAALLHDIGKPRTQQRSDKTGDYTFYHHEKVGADMADQWLREYRFSNSEREHMVALVRHHLICYSSEWSDAAVRRFIRRVGQERVEPLLRLAHADTLGKGKPVEQELAELEELRARIDRAVEEGNAFTTRDLEVSGRDVLPRLQGRPGPVVAQILQHLLERVLDDPALNRRDKLLTLLDEVVPEFETQYGIRGAMSRGDKDS